jgi:hypothetical protein
MRQLLDPGGLKQPDHKGARVLAEDLEPLPLVQIFIRAHFLVVSVPGRCLQLAGGAGAERHGRQERVHIRVWADRLRQDFHHAGRGRRLPRRDPPHCAVHLQLDQQGRGLRQLLPAIRLGPGGLPGDHPGLARPCQQIRDPDRARSTYAVRRAPGAGAGPEEQARRGDQLQRT